MNFLTLNHFEAAYDWTIFRFRVICGHSVDSIYILELWLEASHSTLVDE